MAAFSALALGAGLASTATGAIIKADAASKKAEAARQTQERAEQIRAEAKKASLPTPSEIAAMDSVVQQREAAVNNSLAEIRRFEESVESLDPVIREASNQQLDILKGRASAMLKPVREARERRRAKMEQELASRLGPGFRSSTAGASALIQFDQSTDDMMAQTQFNALNQLGQTAQGAASTRSALVQNLAQISAIGSTLSFGELQARGALKGRELEAILRAPIPDPGAALRAQAEGQEAIGGLFEQIGGTGLGFGLAGPKGAAKDEQADSQLNMVPLGAPPINLQTPQLGDSAGMGRKQPSFNLGGGIVSPLTGGKRKEGIR